MLWLLWIGLTMIQVGTSLDVGAARLQEARAAHVEISMAGGWPAVSPGASLGLGVTSTRVSTLRRRLARTGDLDGDSGSQTFDPKLDRAVRAFQRRHGLVVDGIVGPRTRSALNVPVEARIAQIDVNLRRRPVPIGEDRYARVNIAAYEMVVVDSERVMLKMRVIVGAVRTPTPRLEAVIEHVVLAPYWYVPQSIARNELLPAERSSPGYLRSHHIVRLSSGTLRQDPGPDNPLGGIKFLMPNSESISLHDTPARDLFEAAVRAFSHGCIRIERPLDLATYLLRGTEWTPERMREAIAAWEQIVIPVLTPLPVYLVYETAWVDEEGVVHFRPDIYGLDAASIRG